MAEQKDLCGGLVAGCDLCGDFPVHLRARCHPTAPLRMEMDERGKVSVYCYVPECNRFVAELWLHEHGEK